MIVAFDLSLTSIGWARVTEPAPTPEVGTIRPRGRSAARLQDALNQIIPIARGARLALIEGYAHGKNYQAHQLGELGGVVRLGFHQLGITWLAIPPKCTKKLATGNGNAKKEMMLAAAFKRLGYEGFSYDEADALWLLQVAAAHYGLACAAVLPAKHYEFQSQVEWPQIGGAS